MDWYSWLSKTNMDPVLVYEYGLAFVRNELQEEDLSYFDHEFLQSIGISVAKHRLEILKLARKEGGGRSGPRTANISFSRLVLAMSKTRKALTKNIIGKWGFHKSSTTCSLPRFQTTTELQPSPSPYRNQWSGALKRANGTIITKEGSMDNVMWSGPLLDRRVHQEKQLVVCQSVSGPLDYGKLMAQQERSVVGPNCSPLVRDKMGALFCKSPTINGPVERWGLSPKVNFSSCGRSAMVGGGGDDLGVQSLWSLMFQDMKPT